MRTKPIEWAGRILRKAGNELLRRNGLKGTWIDVGAHHGEVTLCYANHNPGLRIFAFEPNLRAAAKMIGKSSNFNVIPMAVAEKDGFAEFQINAYDQASSLLPMDEEARKAWGPTRALAVESTVIVPTIRLDTFMNLFEISKVDFLKIDTQGMDLAVLKSAGHRLRDCAKITLEVDISPQHLYSGSPAKDELVSFMRQAGFEMISAESQSDGREENLTFLLMQ
jgi:FkbM family methyltransferase